MPSQLVTVRARPTAVVADTTTWERFPRLWPHLLDEVYAAVRPQAVPGARWQNVMLYHDDRPSVEVGVLAPPSFRPTGRVVASPLPGGPVVMTTHRGPCDRLDRAHDTVHRLAAERGLDLAGPRWEIYGHHDDAREPETEVFYLLG